MTESSILLTDGYKLGHRQQYPEGTEYVYSNWTARSNHYLPEARGVVVFGIQYLVQKYLIEEFNTHFFKLPRYRVLSDFYYRTSNFLGRDTNIGLDHIADLHSLGYLPIEIKALPEGMIAPIGVPILTIVNTLPEFFWLTNYLETLISSVLWLPMTSATVAKVYKQRLEDHADKTGFNEDINLEFLCHDFSMRGMAGIEAAIMSGMGHLTSFVGSETIPAIGALEKYYSANAATTTVAATIPATEHSVMCAGGDGEDEFTTFKRLITKVYPSGYVSIVSDTWDFWQVMTEYLPRLKDEIEARDGRVVIRPDSGDPVDIICGTSMYADSKLGGVAAKGAYEILWDIFGGTINEKGFKVLSDKVGIIYGDSITLERQKEIYKRLEDKGFAATNLVLGIGSYTYQYKTRDSLGFAMKATWCQINGEGKMIYKQPKTDDGTKNSLRGIISVVESSVHERLVAIDGGNSLDHEDGSILQTVFKDGEEVNHFTFNQIRERLDGKQIY